MRPLSLSIGVLLAVAACTRAPRRAAECLPYGPDTVRLTGTLHRLTLPGPPNYEDVQAGDTPETGFYLDLSAPICAAGGREAALGEAHAGVQEIQLVLDSAGSAALAPHLDQPIAVRGTLFPAHTAHHHAPVLLDVLRPARAEAP